MRIIYMLFLSTFSLTIGAQTPGVSIFYEQYIGDTREYIEYIPGNLPIIISAPHGGVKQSGSTVGPTFYPDNDATLPDRTCGTNERDNNTEILVREIQNEIFQLTGCYAHIIISNLHAIINKSTISNLVGSNISEQSHEALIRGYQSLGELFQQAAGTYYASLNYPGCTHNGTNGYRAVPSDTDTGNQSCDDTRPYNNSYFDGDFYNNRRHGSGTGAHDGNGNLVGGGGSIDGIMTEVNRRVRDLGTYQGTTKTIEIATSRVAFVDLNAAGSGDGSSWMNAYPTLEAALDAECTYDSIKVAEGTYIPDTQDRNYSFNLYSNLVIQGGHAIGGIAYDPNLYTTIISGNIGGSQETDNLCHVINVNNTVSDLELQNLHLKHGYADGSGDIDNVKL